MKKTIVLFFSLFLIASCAKEIIDLTGSIKGVVKDESGNLIEDCLISITPTGTAKITGPDGSFEFTKLDPGDYTITVKKEGYTNTTLKVTVLSGKEVNADVILGNAYGGIKGVVKDEEEGSFIENCLVFLSPGGASITTGADGVFEFKDLAAGDYTLNLKKTGYPDKSVTTNVVKGKMTNVDVRMKLEDPISFSESELNFGDFETTKTFTLFNNSDGDCTFAISNIPSWLSLSQTNASVSKQSRTTIVATANRDKIGYGTFVQNLIIAYSGRVSGEAMIKASIEKVLLTTPEVTIYSSAENVTENSFDIKGNIVATGGSQILDYGHCWSTKANPTTNDNCTRLGQRNELGVYSSSITGLMTSTTYYVRAYARNAQGIAYSEQIEITTQAPYNDKWDGNIASGYAGGSGTIVDPYIIKTGGQLLYAFKQGEGYLKLANNIDLNNHNWKPFSFSGTLDGGGHTISNLYIDRTNEESCGLIRYLSGTISDLTICGVCVKGSSKVGAFAGYSDESTLSNCHLILTTGSKIEGTTYVGGLLGGTGPAASSQYATIINCSVESLDAEAYIYGDKNVGGISGRSVKATDCHVSCNIYGGSTVGGIVGIYVHGIENCSYKGNISGKYSVGGIVGYCSGGKIIACKVNANIEGTEDVGCVYGEWDYNMPTIIACYSEGNINSIYGYSVGGRLGTLSYTTMQSESPGYYITNTENDSFSIYNSDNITQDLKESYSEYAHYWNFENQWTWTGTVNGQTKQIKCPRLAWE